MDEVDSIEVELYRKLRALRWSVVRRVGQQLADDVIHDVFVKLIKKVRSGEVEQIDHYLSVALVNRCLEILRVRADHQEKEFQFVYLQPKTTGCYQEDREQELMEVIDKVLNGKRREVIVMRLVIGKTVEETARDLGLSIQCIKSRSYQAIKTLRKELGGGLHGR